MHKPQDKPQDENRILANKLVIMNLAIAADQRALEAARAEKKSPLMPGKGIPYNYMAHGYNHARDNVAALMNPPFWTIENK